MTVIHLKLKSRCSPYFLGAVFFLLGACVHNPSETASIDVAKPQVERAPVGLTEKEDSPLDINQIASVNIGFKASQISTNVEANQLTIEQLRDYADRCAPGSSLPHGDLDCSELSLRVKKIFRSDDLIQEALITLDHLGREGNENTGQNELEQSSRNLSNSALSIASGLLETPPTDPIREPQIDNLDNILNQLGLGQNSGAIINSGG